MGIEGTIQGRELSIVGVSGTHGFGAQNLRLQVADLECNA